MTESYLKCIEWEFLQEPLQITEITPSPHLPQGSERIEIWRDESYKLKAKIIGTTQPGENNELFDKIEKGKIIELFTITGSSSRENCKYELTGGCIKSYHETSTHEQTTFEADLIISEVKAKTLTDSEVAWLTDWYLNGPKKFIFPRNTHRKMSQNFERHRKSIDTSSMKYTKEGSMNIAFDFAFIENNEVKFLLTRVPEEIKPEWSKKIGIEFRKEFGEIPAIEKREAISEAVSFIMGRQLLYVGYTKYNHRGRPLEQVAFSPWSENAMVICQQPDNFPISFIRSQIENPEKVLNKIVPCYLSLRDELKLKEVLWRYWISRSMPIGTNLPILSSGLEILANAWFKTNKSKKKGKYLPQEVFDQLLQEEFDQISQKLSGEEFGDRIIKRMHGSNIMGINESFQFFFNEIDLNTGSIEKQAINARNKMAHGYLKSDKDILKMSRMTFAYETLFHRVILKILGYDCDYIDRSTIGFPERHINEPLGGNQTS